MTSLPCTSIGIPSITGSEAHPESLSHSLCAPLPKLGPQRGDLCAGGSFAALRVAVALVAMLLRGMDILIASPIATVFAGLLAVALDRKKVNEVIDAAIDRVLSRMTA